MKYIEKPQPILIGDKSFAIDDLLAYLVAGDRRFNESGAGIRAGIRLEDVVKSCKSLPYIGPIQPEHHSILVVVSEEPSCGFPKLVGQGLDGQRLEIFMGRQLLPFVDAIANAKNEPPLIEEPKEEPKATNGASDQATS